MATKTQSCLNKQILNNFIVQNRPNVRRGKVHVINKIVRRSRQLRQQKTSNEQEKEKICRKADKLIEELTILRKFYEDDLTKFALLNKKSLIEVTNDMSSPLEERALCRLATYKTVGPEITKFREQYPDWEDKVPQLLKSIGLQYRNKRLKRLDKKGRKDQFLEKEHHNLSILQQLTHIDVDPRLLAKARDLMNMSKTDKDIGKNKFDSKGRNNDNTFEEEGMEGQDLYAGDNSGDEYDMDRTNSEMQDKCRKNISKKKQKVKDYNKNSKEYIKDEVIAGKQEKCKKVMSKEEEKCKKVVSKKDKKCKNVASKKEDISDESGEEEEDISDESDEEEASLDTEKCRKVVSKKEKCKKVVSKKNKKCKNVASKKEDISDESDEEEASLDTEETLNKDHDEGSEEEESISENESDEDENCNKNILRKEEWMEEQDEESEENVSSHESDDVSEDDRDSKEGISDCDSDIDEGFTKKSNSNVLHKRKEKPKKSIILENKDNTKAVKKKKKGKPRRDVASDSEGITSNESDIECGITSIWESWKDEKDIKDSKVSKVKGLKSKSKNVNESSGGNKIIKSKGTVEVRLLDLTDQRSIDALFERNDGKMASDSEDDYFVSDASLKKRKRPKEGNTSDNEEVADESEKAYDDGPHFDEASTRERYLDRNFRRIWGKGMDKMIPVPRGAFQRGGRRGGGFDSSRGQGYRGRAGGNSNLMPLNSEGNNLPSEKSYGNVNMIPVSSDWRSKISSEKRNDGTPRVIPVTSDLKNESSQIRDGEQSKWKRGSFDKRNESNPDLAPSSNWKNRFGSGRREEEQVKPGWKRGRFERRDNNNANLAPVSGSWRDNDVQGRKDNTQSSLLHPSWLAKQKEREKESSINHFQGKVKKFDWDD